MLSHVNSALVLRLACFRTSVLDYSSIVKRYFVMTASNQVNKRSQPSWTPPEGSHDTDLKLYNSLTRKKESFIPLKGKKVSWYTCGPTVYDDSHMGHARSYISFDIMRRILMDYFKYDVFYVMNITDIDDKIIKRARRTHLFNEYAKGERSINDIVDDAQSSLELLSKKLSSEVKVDKKNMYAKMYNEAKELLDDKSKHTSQALLKGLKDVLSDWLDEKDGSFVRENDIFLDLPRKFEKLFHEDMKALNVLPPNALTRVSEYIPEIIAYIQKIIDQGYGYASSGSVYFDTVKFDQSPNHFYAKLVPEAFGDTCALEEGEGDLSVSEERLKEKKNITDFALWKTSKSGEPSWDSPWGKGRPGWHIECSAMASELLGTSMDIHTGGVDLKFPHHDNELAQSEAYFGNNDWVKYFLHSGHLTIKDCKMSKSLKNFITIKDALKEYSSKQIRLLFLLHGWDDTLDYGEKTMSDATSYEKTLNNFFGMVSDILWKQKDSIGAYKKWTNEEFDLNKKFISHKDEVHEQLCDNLDTRGALESIGRLISHANKYVDLKKKNGQLPNELLLKDISDYIKGLFKIFGAFEGDGVDSTDSNEQLNNEKMEYIRALSAFRDKVKQKVRNAEDIRKVKLEVLELSDQLRDDVLPFLGVQLEDKEGEDAIVKFVDKKILLKEREAKLEKKRQKQKEKEEKLIQQEAKLEAGKMPPSEMFKNQTHLYSSFDEQGIPTHDDKGEPLTKTHLKKLKKSYDTQAKKHLEYLKSLESHQNGF